LLKLVEAKGWTPEVMDKIVVAALEPKSKWSSQEVMAAMARNWKAEYISPFMELLMKGGRHGEIMKDLQVLAYVDPASTRSILDELWLRHDLLGLENDVPIDLAYAAMCEGNVSALLTVLGYLKGRVSSIHVRKYASHCDELPWLMESTAQAMLGQPLSANALFDWAFAHKQDLRFDPATRRYVVAAVKSGK
jgi:hypothetical protein